MNLPLKGIIPPMTTPLLEDGSLDYKGIENLIGHILNGGVHGIFLLGTTGEGPSLDHAIRKKLVSKACDIVAGRVPVLVCISDTSIIESIALAHHAKEVGADALVVAPPYYFPLSQSQIEDYYGILAPDLPLPFLMYNMPSCTKLQLSIETVKKVKELGAIGIKDSSGNRSYLLDLIKEFKSDNSFAVLTGTELFLTEIIRNGGNGVVAGGANFFPRLYVDLYEASLTNDLERISDLSEKVAWIGDTIYKVGKDETRYVRSIKSAVSALDICQDYMAPPLTRFKPEQQNQIRSFINGYINRNIFPKGQ